MLLILFLSITLPIIILIYIIIISQKKTLNINLPPGPPGLPLIGNLHQFAADKNPHVFLRKLSQKYGPVLRMQFGAVPVLVVSSSKAAKEVMKTQDLSFCSRPRLLGQQKFSYNCIDMFFSPYNDYWREVRKITAIHLFSVRKVQSFRPIREDEIARMVNKISGLASPRKAVNLSEIAMAMASALICRVAFGKRFDEEGDEMRRFGELTTKAQALMVSFYVSDYFPAFGWVDKVSGLISRLETTFKGLDSFYEELIKEHVDCNRVKEKSGEEDILDVLIRLKEENTCCFDLEWDHIKALLMDIFVAGTDTTAATTVWAMTALMKSPNAMKNAQAELRKEIAEKGKVEEEDLHKLPYLKAVISETLRLYPPAPLLVPRETIEKSVLEGYEIQPKTLVYVNAWAIARDPEYWENAEEFLPERFLKNNVDIKGQDFSVIPFGSGRRICSGMFMGLANVELAVANLLYAFDWELPDGNEAEDIDLDCLAGLTMHKKNALYLVPKKYVIT